jgi:peptidoglycan/LPS O-acetylase OafA/YrhL
MRIAVLDSLRGLAAGSVILYHALFFIPSTQHLLDFLRHNVYADPSLESFIISFSPLSILLMGREWIVFFFVLSGFVLALPFYGKRPPSYLNFAVRRFCRLIIPATAIMAFSILLLLLLGTDYPPGYAKFFNMHWQEPISLPMVLRHMLLIPDPSAFEVPFSLNTPLWTLVVEWRVGLLFPLLIILARRSDWLLLTFAFAALVLSAGEQRLFGTDHLLALRWVPCFSFGILLAKHYKVVVERIQAMTPATRAWLWVACILLLYIRALTPPIETQTRQNLANGVGVTLLMALMLASPRLMTFLESRPLLWLGKIAFSLYLCHLPIMLAMPRILPASISPVPQMFIAGILSIPVAALLFRLIEEPSIEWGKRLGPAADRLAARIGWTRATTPVGGTTTAAVSQT